MDKDLLAPKTRVEQEGGRAPPTIDMALREKQNSLGVEEKTSPKLAPLGKREVVVEGGLPQPTTLNSHQDLFVQNPPTNNIPPGNIIWPAESNRRGVIFFGGKFFINFGSKLLTAKC